VSVPRNIVLQADQPVLVVEEQHRKHLVLQAAQVQRR
jgi:hypothetical protein